MPLGIIKKARILGDGYYLISQIKIQVSQTFFSCFIIIIIIIITISFCKTLIYKIEYLSISHKFNILQFDNDTKYIRQRRMRSHLVGLYV